MIIDTDQSVDDFTIPPELQQRLPTHDDLFPPELRDIFALKAARSLVNIERDRRIANLFSFAGIAYQLDDRSQRNIIAKGAQAKFAVLSGAAADNLRWADPDHDFGWIATDNSVTPMDAQTMAAFADAADRWVTIHIMTGNAIKAMDPPPADIAADTLWPALV